MRKVVAACASAAVAPVEPARGVVVGLVTVTVLDVGHVSRTFGLFEGGRWTVTWARRRAAGSRASGSSQEN